MTHLSEAITNTLTLIFNTQQLGTASQMRISRFPNTEHFSTFRSEKKFYFHSTRARENFRFFDLHIYDILMSS